MTASARVKSNRDLQPIKATLESLRREALRRLSGLDGMEDGNGDEGDRARRQHDQDLTHAGRERLLETVRLADEALVRLREGTYGSCSDCTMPIPAARLRVLPQARRCLRCQTRSDSARFSGEPERVVRVRIVGLDEDMA